MKEFSISVKIVGDEYYTVQAETFDEAVKLIKEGKLIQNGMSLNGVVSFT